MVPPLSLLRMSSFPHELGERTTQNQLAASSPNDFGTHPGQQQTRQVAVGELVATDRVHVERVRAVDALVLFAVAGIGAGQGAQRHHSRHEPKIGVRFAGRNKLVHLVGLGEVVPSLGRDFAERHHQLVQAVEGFPSRNQLAAFRLHGFYSPMFPRQKTTGGGASATFEGVVGKGLRVQVAASGLAKVSSSTATPPFVQMYISVHGCNML